MFPLRSAALCITVASASAATLDFNRDVRPILSDKCFACHGPDEKHRKAKLRLDTREGAIEDHDGVRAINPDNLANSEFLFRITATDEDELMPPPDTNKPLTEQERDVLRRWIESGGGYDDHWAFVPPSKPPVPHCDRAGWSDNPIDPFIAGQLDSAGLTPNTPADRRTLARRVALDLTGLPPTPAELDAFLNDHSQAAYDDLVDRLIASPRFGEHMTRYWLDAARYGDTHGLHLDNYREFYPYRDWVIKAFNDNKSYAEFLTEQLAGDLLPSPAPEQVVATGFNRAHVTTSEGGSIAEEVYVRNVKDRTETFGTLFLGLTVTCAGCHNHKYDPITQNDYYSLFAYFNSLDANPLDGNQKDHAPVIRVPTPDQRSTLDALETEIASIREQVDREVAAYNYREPETPNRPTIPAPTDFVWIEDSIPAGAAPTGPWNFREAEQAPVHSGKKSHSQTAQGLDQHLFINAKSPLIIGEGDRLFAHVYLDPKNPPKEIMLQWNDGTWEHRAYWGQNVIPWGSDNSPSRYNAGPLPAPGTWTRIEVPAEAVGLKPGAAVNGWAFTQHDGTVHWDRSGIVTTNNQNPTFDSMRDWIAHQRNIESPTVPDPIASILNKPPGALTDRDRQQATHYFIEHVYAGTREHFASLHRQIADLENQITATQNQFPTTLVWKELPEPKPSHVLNRGEYDQKQHQVPRAVPAFLPPLPEGAPQDRLGLARWLLDPGHPLFARVTVNRLWQQVFGTGIVKTSEDFGLQGEPPSHPELLDYLAVHFRESGWDIKAFMKLLVTSATYRQSSAATPEKLAADPYNRLYARGPRFRLDAESIRDQALAVSGLLVEKIGGPGVKPPQPDGLWRSVGYSGSNTVRFVPDQEHEKIHRRSLYTFWKRTSPPPQMNIIDAPSRESCTVRRERTNTPLQALLLMNDPQFFEAARHFAQRAIAEGGTTPQSRLTHMFQLALSRPPTPDELAILHDTYLDHARTFAANPDKATQTVTVGPLPVPADINIPELATYTMLANLILNLDEFITKN